MSHVNSYTVSESHAPPPTPSIKIHAYVSVIYLKFFAMVCLSNLYSCKDPRPLAGIYSSGILHLYVHFQEKNIHT